MGKRVRKTRGEGRRRGSAAAARRGMRRAECIKRGRVSQSISMKKIVGKIPAQPVDEREACFPPSGGEKRESCFPHPDREALKP